MKYVIIGNGAASIGAIEGIRRHDRDGGILVVSEENVPTYGRPLISYYLAGKIDADRLALRNENFYSSNKVEMKLSTRVEKIDIKTKEIRTTDGSATKYEKLLVATGGTPFNPPIPGADGSGIYNFTTQAHADELIKVAGKIKRAVVIGGGLIGLKAAESLHDRGIQVSIVELASRVLSAAFDDAAGNLVARKLESVGINIFCNAQTKEIKRDKSGNIKGVVLADDRFLEAQAVVIAIGVRAEATLAKDAGLSVGRGIEVNDFLCAHDSGIYAAGDVAQATDLLSGQKVAVPIWPNAYSQGYFAGMNMAGANKPYPGGLSYNAIGFYGMPTTSCGLVNPAPDQGCEVFAELNEERKTYRKLVFKDDCLVGCVLVGDVDDAGVYTSFIRFKLPAGGEVGEALKSGKASMLLWPEEFFRKTWSYAS